MALKPQNQLSTSHEPPKTVSSSFQVPSKRLISKKPSLNWNSIQFSTRLMLLLCSRFQCLQKIISCLKAMFCSSPCILEVIVLRFRDQGIDGSEASVWDEEGKNWRRRNHENHHKELAKSVFMLFTHVASHTLRSRLATSNSQRLFSATPIASFCLWVIKMGRISK